MRLEQFNDIMGEQFDMCETLLDKKASIYSNGHDRLVQFKISANLQGCSVPRAVSGKMAKHTTLVYDLVKDIDKGKKVSHAQWNETITDHINYLILLRAVLVEEGLLK